MKTEILKCAKCSAYTLNPVCPQCQQQALSPKPAKFSVEDKWGKYRRIAKRQQEQAEQSKDL